VASRDLWQRLRENGEIRLNSPIELMRFTLVYEGPLSSQPSAEGSRGEDPRATEKHAIRTQLHRQLRDFWMEHEYLKKDLWEWTKIAPSSRQAWEAKMEAKHEKGLVCSFPVGTFTFIPLVTKYHFLVCELDILFLRAERAGSLFTSKGAGDVDNRLKVLFDALRMPDSERELPPFQAPADETEDPMFCLLQDDRLITAVRLEAEQLYDPGPKKPNEVKLIIRVAVKTQHLSIANMRIVSAG
jgi:hypothetical protein